MAAVTMASDDAINSTTTIDSCINSTATHDSPNDKDVRRLKKRSIVAKLANKTRNSQPEDVDTGLTIDNRVEATPDSATSTADQPSPNEAQQKLKRHCGNSTTAESNRENCKEANKLYIKKLLRPSISDTGVVQSYRYHADSDINPSVLSNGIDSNVYIHNCKASLQNGDKASSETTINRLRLLKMSSDTPDAQFRHLPTPPTTPRQSSTKGEKRDREPYSSSEERDHDRIVSKPKRTSFDSVTVGTTRDVGDRAGMSYAIIDDSSQLRGDEYVIGNEASNDDVLNTSDPILFPTISRDNTLSIIDKIVPSYDRDSPPKIINSPKYGRHDETNINNASNTSLSKDALPSDLLLHGRSNRLTPLSPSHNLPPLPFDPLTRAYRTAYKSENATMRDILLERNDSIGEYKSADSLSLASNSGLPIIFTHQVKNKGVNLNASTQSNSSLLGADEMNRYLPDRKLNIFVGSWNMCEIKTCPISLDDFILPSSTKILLDMYVIGTQENAMNKKEWEIQLQETLGLSHVLIYSATHGALHIAAFMRRDLMWFCSGLDWDCVSTRAITVVKTKGAVAMSVRFFGTSMLFVNSHLTCSSSKTKHRMADYEKIIKELRLPKVSTSQGSILTRYDCIFWCGDLNFRIEKGRSNVDVMLGHLNTLDHPNFEDLIAGDQLYKCITEGRIFQDFQEGRITFSPTYKFDINSDKYDTSSKMRIPSYTDRVLFRSKVKNSITCVCYDAVMDIKVSDHRPVYAQFQAAVQPIKDGRHPVSELKFDKAVYIEANRRRGLHQQLSNRGDKSSAVCRIM